PPAAISVVSGSDVARAYDNGADQATFLGGGAPQEGGAPNLDTLSPRTQVAVYHNGMVTGCNCGEIDGDALFHIFWAETSPNGGIAVNPPITRQTGHIDGTTSADAVYMPALSVNDHGETLVGYCESSASKFEEIRYVDREFSDALGTME